MIGSENKVFSIRYSVRDRETSELIDSNTDGKPLEFLMGANQVISGLEAALVNRQVGDSFQVEISPEDAYGEYRVDYLQEVPREEFEGIELERGMSLIGQGEHGQVRVVVKDFSDDVVMIDYNHPLAGKTLCFDVKILDIREATEKEVIDASGFAGGGCCGGHGGGCCGGGGGDHHGEGGCGCHH